MYSDGFREFGLGPAGLFARPSDFGTDGRHPTTLPQLTVTVKSSLTAMLPGAQHARPGETNVPIKALKPRLSIAGYIKIGEKERGAPRTSKRGTEYRRAKKLDYIRVTTTERDETDNLRDDPGLTRALKFHNATAEQQKAFRNGNDKAIDDVKVRRVPILLHTDIIDEALQADYVSYVGRYTRYKVCDGETCTLFKLVKRKDGDGYESTGISDQIDCECPKSPNNGLVSARYWDGKTPKRKEFICKPHAQFRCHINLPGAAGPGALYEFRTSGYSSIQRLTGGLQAISENLNGHIAHVPLLLVMEPAKGKDGQGRQTHNWALSVRLDVELMTAIDRLRKIHAERALIGAVEQRALTSSVPEGTREEESEVVEEFFPDAIDTEAEEVGDPDVDVGDDDDSSDDDGDLFEESSDDDYVPGGADADNRSLQKMRHDTLAAFARYKEVNPGKRAQDLYREVCEGAGFANIIVIESEENPETLRSLEDYMVKHRLPF